MVAEPLGKTIKKGKEIKGIVIEEGQEENNIFQYEDDPTLTVEEMRLNGFMKVRVQSLMKKKQYL